MSQLNERDAYILLIESLRNAENLARALGPMRLNTRWLKIANILVKTQETVNDLYKTNRQAEKSN